jgi:hypothetical protein
VVDTVADSVVAIVLESHRGATAGARAAAAEPGILAEPAEAEPECMRCWHLLASNGTTRRAN